MGSDATAWQTASTSPVPWLTLLVLLPLLGAVVVALAGRVGGLSAGAVRGLALGWSLAVLAYAGVVAVVADVGSGPGLHLVEERPWIDVVGAHWALGLDGLGLVMVLLTAVLVPVVLAVPAHTDGTGASARGATTYAGLVLVLEAVTLTVFLATDVFLFYVVFEASLVPAYFLLGGFGRAGERARAAAKFLVYQLAGGLVMLAAVIGLYAVSTDAGDGPTYLLRDLAALGVDETTARWLFVGFFVAFAVKAPLFPVHTWLADATGAATPGTSVLLVCVLDKIGTFAMLRFCLGLFPEASAWATPVVVVLALVSIVYGAFLAMGADDLLRLVGLTSLSHFGFIVLGIFVFTGSGHSGAILYMVNHGIATAALFLTAGYLVHRTGTRSIAAMGGLEGTAPVLAGLFLVAGLATLGLPGLSPFVSEFLVVLAAFDRAWWVGAVAVTGIVWAAVYVLRAYRRTMTGPPRDDAGRGPVADLTRRESAVLVPLVVALVGFGLYPAPLLDVVRPGVDATLQHVQDRTPGSDRTRDEGPTHPVTLGDPGAADDEEEQP